jgi:hypothetical protein
MNKNLIALAVSAALVAPMVAVADTTVFGDMRVRYSATTTDNDVMAAEAKDDSTNSRIRVGVESKMDDVTVKLRIKSHDGTHGNGLATIKADYGYMSVPLGPVTVSGGLMVGNFGNKLTYWDTRPNRVALSTKLGADWTGVLTFDKMRESGEADKVDKSSMKIILNGKLPMGKAGLMYNSVEDNAVAGDTSGTETILYFNGKVPGDVKLLGEYNSRSGKVFEDADGDASSALYVHGIKQFGAADVHLAYIMTADGFVADDHFAPFSTIGTSQDTAMMDWGGVDESSTIALMAGMNVMPKLRVQAGYGAVTAKQVKGAPEGSATVLDLQAVYSVNKMTNITAVYGSVDMDKDLMSGTQYTVMGARMETKF